MMDLGTLEAFAVDARRQLLRNVGEKIDYALQDGNALKRLYPKAVGKLEEAVERDGREAVAEKTAYTWFNRFCALRFMDVNGYTDSGVVTPTGGGVLPGILSEARDGNFDETLFASGAKKRVVDILSGAMRTDDPNSAAYRALFVATCNAWHERLPFLFEKLGDESEVLLPDDLLSASSILAKVRAALPPEACADVEVIGWLYQFYISEKKDRIAEGFKRNVKAEAEDLPAVTQLFTPHWIVKYLVQNSLGRLWMKLHPDSPLIGRMEYFVPDDGEHPVPVPEEIGSPEDLRLCDPCCGSGHMLVYAFDLLYSMYEESGYSRPDIPGLILGKNLYGIELDPRAAALAGFALAMKARSRHSGFFRNPVQPNILAIRPVSFNEGELRLYREKAGDDLFTPPLEETLGQFGEADNFGSLIVPKLRDAGATRSLFAAKDLENDLLRWGTHQKVLQALRQAEFLSPRYHVVVTNPPYLGGKSMNDRLRAFAKDRYPMSKGDLFAMFIERCLGLCAEHGVAAMITMQSWMFLSSFEALRKWLFENKTILSMAHLGARAFDTISGEVVSTTAFVLANECIEGYRGGFIRLVNGQNEAEKARMLADALQPRDAEGLRAPGKRIQG